MFVRFQKFPPLPAGEKFFAGEEKIFSAVHLAGAGRARGAGDGFDEPVVARKKSVYKRPLADAGRARNDKKQISHTLFQILDLFTDLFDLVFHCEGTPCDLAVVGFGTDRIALTVEFLNEEVELSAHRLLFCDEAELLDMG